jgi:hypothetical protein
MNNRPETVICPWTGKCGSFNRDQMSSEPTVVICSHADICERKKPCPHKQPHEDDLSCRLAEKDCVWFAARCLPLSCVTVQEEKPLP